MTSYRQFPNSHAAGAILRPMLHALLALSTGIFGGVIYSQYAKSDDGEPQDETMARAMAHSAGNGLHPLVNQP